MNRFPCLPFVVSCLIPFSVNAAVTPEDVLPPVDEVINEQWAMSSLWDDGKAEVATYDGIKSIYGAEREHTHRLITVKEDFNTDYNVKADWPYDGKSILPVIKQNQVAMIQTPNYPYHMMTSVFFERENLENCVKLSVATQEWCGITNKEFSFEDEPTISFMSYWDGQGTGRNRLKGFEDSNVYFQEELPLLVRTLEYKDGAVLNLSVYPNQTYTQVNPDVKPFKTTLAIESEKNNVNTPYKDYGTDELWEITVGSDQNDNDMTFHVEKTEPHTLVHYDFGDGRSYKLNDVTRRAYWKIGE